jgi:uncharacterized membrane protein YhiD involved in acid resistance
MNDSTEILELIKLYSSNQGLLIKGDLDAGVFIFSLLVALLTSTFIALIYRFKHQGVFFQPSFQLSIICACLITTMVIYTIGGNLILSLGLVGALSIVRFRTAVKDAQDIIYIYWSIAIGMSCATLNYAIAILGTLIISLVIYAFSYLSSKKDDGRLLVTLSGQGDDVKKAVLMTQKYSSKTNQLFEIHNEHGDSEVSLEAWVSSQQELSQALSEMPGRHTIYTASNKFGSVD